jgi:hypothetical protein
VSCVGELIKAADRVRLSRPVHTERPLRAFIVASSISILVLGGHGPRQVATAAHTDDACAVLTPDDIAKTISWKVGAGAPGKPVPGVLGKCTWTNANNGRVIVTLTDARHASITVQAWEGAGGKDLSGIGTKAVSIKATDLTGGWIVTVEDSKGGFGVSVLGRTATEDNAIALAKIVEGHRK